MIELLFLVSLLLLILFVLSVPVLNEYSFYVKRRKKVDHFFNLLNETFLYIVGYFVEIFAIIKEKLFIKNIFDVIKYTGDSLIDSRKQEIKTNKKQKTSSFLSKLHHTKK